MICDKCGTNGSIDKIEIKGILSNVSDNFDLAFNLCTLCAREIKEKIMQLKSEMKARNYVNSVFSKG